MLCAASGCGPFTNCAACSAPMPVILHITNKAQWTLAKSQGVYKADSLASEGFIHCSTLTQTAGTANALFADAEDLVLLVIDPEIVTAEIKYEPPADNGEADPNLRFPHIYGPLNLDAVIRVVDFPPDADGHFSLPQELNAP